jgi:hypothetical protein
MKFREAIPWILASLPLLCVGYMFVEIAEAVFHMGHLPRYMVDPDPFHTAWESVLPDVGSFIYFPLPLLLVLALVLLALPQIRYRGNHRMLFYGLVVVSVFVTWLFTIHDLTGFVSWRLD